MARQTFPPTLRMAGILWACALGWTVFAANQTPTPPSVASARLVQIGSIPLKQVDGRLDHPTWDPKSQRLFVSALENHTIEVLDLRTKQRIHQIAGVNEPLGLFVHPETRRLFVCCRGDGTCRSFDADNFQEGPWVDLGRNADNVRFDPISKLVFIGSGGEPGNGLLSAVDLVALLPVEMGGQPAPPHSPADFLLDRPRQADPRMEVQLPAHPESFQLDSARNRIFVNVPDEHKIFILNFTNYFLTSAARWPVTVGEKNFPMAFDPASARLFIACRKPACLAVYDSHSGALLSRVRCVGDADDIFYQSELRRLYLIGGEGFVDLFEVSASGNQPIAVAHLPTAARARTGLFIPEQGILAVAAPHTTNNSAVVLLFKAQT